MSGSAEAVGVTVPGLEPVTRLIAGRCHFGGISVSDQVRCMGVYTPATEWNNDTIVAEIR